MHHRRGERRMHFDGNSFIVRNAGHSAGFDDKNQLKVYWRYHHIIEFYTLIFNHYSINSMMLYRTLPTIVLSDEQLYNLILFHFCVFLTTYSTRWLFCKTNETFLFLVFLIADCCETSVFVGDCIYHDWIYEGICKKSTHKQYKI